MFSISLYSFLRVRDSLILVITGILLLGIGLDGVSRAQNGANLGEAQPSGWPLEANVGLGAPELDNDLSIGAEELDNDFSIGAPGADHIGLAERTRNFGIAQRTINFSIAARTPNRFVAESTPTLAAERTPTLAAERTFNTFEPLLNAIPQEINDATLGIEDELEPDFDDTLIRNSVGNLFRLIEGAFGALLVVGAGIAAIIAGVVGAYKAAFALFVTAIGAFILRAYVSLFFGTDYTSFEAGVGGQAAGF